MIENAFDKTSLLLANIWITLYQCHQTSGTAQSDETGEQNGSQQTFFFKTKVVLTVWHGRIQRRPLGWNIKCISAIK